MVKVNYSEKLTFHEWEQIHKALKEQSKQERKQERRYYIKQKLVGGSLVVLSVLCPLLLQDITASVFLLPLGVGVMVTKDKVI